MRRKSENEIEFLRKIQKSPQDYADTDAYNEDRKRIKRQLSRIIETELTARQREAFKMRFYQKMSMTDIARQQGVDKSTVSRTISRAESRVLKGMKYVTGNGLLGTTEEVAE